MTRSTTPPAEGPSRLLLLWTIIRVGFVAGGLFGLAQAVALGLPIRSLMGVREWLDTLSFALLSHGILWTIYSAAAGAVVLLIPVLGRPMSRECQPVVVATGLFLAGFCVFFAWAVAAFLGSEAARSVRADWVVLMVLVWVVLIAAAALIARFSIGVRFLDLARARLNAVCVASLLAMGAAAAIQAAEFPHLAPSVRPRISLSDDPKAPNVVLIVMDTQRADRLGVYRYDRSVSPEINRFAQDALVFENAVSAGVWTLPSHASVFTGLLPSQHGATKAHAWLDSRFETLAEILDENGYETLAVSNNTWISQATNATQGFEQVVRPAEIHHARGNSLSILVDRVLYPAGLVGPLLGILTYEDGGAKYTNQWIERWLQRRNPDRPFFLFVNYVEPHHPLRPHGEARRELVDQEDLEESFRNPLDEWLVYSFADTSVYSADDLELMNDLYDAETRTLDHYIGDLLSILASRIGVDDTLIILTSDHGEELGDHGLQGHEISVYNSLAHVPLIVRFPRLFSPGRVSAPVHLIDLFPTILEVTGSVTKGDLPRLGLSLVDAARAAVAEERSSPTVSERPLITERMAPTAHRMVPIPGYEVDYRPYLGVVRSVRVGDWKYIASTSAPPELYNLRNDPNERQNLVDRHPEIAQELAQALETTLAVTEPYSSEAAEEPVPMDGKTRAQLRALGYLE